MYLQVVERGLVGIVHKIGFRGTDNLFLAMNSGHMYSFYVVTLDNIHLYSLQSYVCMVYFTIKQKVFKQINKAID